MTMVVYIVVRLVFMSSSVIVCAHVCCVSSVIDSWFI